MTLFAFNTFNHCRQGRIIVEDITVTMGHQMMALGHRATWSTEPVFIHRDQGINVVLESFADDPKTLERIANAYACGCRFLIVATEEPTEKGFNHGLEPAMIERQNAFQAAAKYAEGILHLVPGEHVTKWYGQFAPAAAAELGYASTLDHGEEFVDQQPGYDFGFFGKMTWRREQMLARLERETGGKVLSIVSLDVPLDVRDGIMRNAKVIVQIRANDEWGMVSSTRCASALNMGRPILAEPHPMAEPWSDVVRFSRSVDEFFKDAALVVVNWRSHHAAQLDKFKRRLTPEVCIGEPLRRIGIV